MPKRHMTLPQAPVLIYGKIAPAQSSRYLPQYCTCRKTDRRARNLGGSFGFGIIKKLMGFGTGYNVAVAYLAKNC
jgi:hypothetical protein